MSATAHGRLGVAASHCETVGLARGAHRRSRHAACTEAADLLRGVCGGLRSTTTVCPAGVGSDTMPQSQAAPRTVAQIRPGDRVVVCGAGPAGLTAAYILAKDGYAVTVLESDDVVGGISRTAQYKQFRFDIGGHRFFTKIGPVQRLWEEILGEDFLDVPRLSRIHYSGKYFDYPLKPMNALQGLGLFEAAAIGASYLKAHFWPSPVEENFEQWVTNRFGKRLYEIFFRTYT
jgi:hypothetical protein